MNELHRQQSDKLVANALYQNDPQTALRAQLTRTISNLAKYVMHQNDPQTALRAQLTRTISNPPKNVMHQNDLQPR